MNVVAALPQSLERGLTNYVEHGIAPGGFLLAVLENDLRRAVMHADSDNAPMIPHIVAYLLLEIPEQCWGSKEAVREWMQDKLEKFRKEL